MHYTQSIQQDTAPCNSSFKYSRVIHIGVFFIAFDIILICLTGDCFINKLKLRDPFKSYKIVTLNTTQVDFYPSINVMWINLLVFQTPDGNRFAKEIGFECGFI